VAPRYEDLGATSAAAIVRVFGDSARPLRFVNYLGLPALALPCGFVDGLPVGLQLVGRPLREDTLFALGAALQGATDWHRAAPRMLR
jgi:Asp-tRNA(Asn)/Glu-tRNA(Gln) amidotransferase A subunit family amidase